MIQVRRLTAPDGESKVVGRVARDRFRVAGRRQELAQLHERLARVFA